MKMQTRAMLIALIAIVLGACESTRVSQYGSGPLTLSPQSQAAFAEYMKRIDQGVFIVSSDGRYSSYTYCDAAMCNWNDINNLALLNCNARVAPRQCKIYADGRTVVWNTTPTPVAPPPKP